MRKFILFATLNILTLTVTAQRWYTVYGSPNHFDGVYDILEDYDKGYYLVGYDVVSSSNGKGWNIKTDINGSLLWDKRLVHPKITEGFAACLDSNGNKYVTGVDFSEINWPFLVKFNACSEKLWCTVFKDWGYTNASPIDILINEEGNIIVLTRFEDGNQQINQVFLLCYNPDGDLLWAKPYASKNDHPLISFTYCTKIYQIGNEYILSGYCYYPYPDDPNHVWMRPLFIGIDSQFNEKWILPFGVSDSIVGKSYSAIPLNDSVIMGVGFKFIMQNPVIRNSMLMFFNHEGEELGFNSIPGDSIVSGTLDNLLIETESINDSLFLGTAVFGPSMNQNPYGELIFDTSGHIFNSISRVRARGESNLIKTFDDKFVIACGISETNEEFTDILLYKINANLETDTIYTQNFIYDSLCPDPIPSGDIDMTDCTLQVGLEEIPSPKEYYANLDAIPIKAYPNPAKDVIMFSYTNTEPHKNINLQCYNTIGKKVHQEYILSGQQGTRLNLSNWNNGLYIAIITINGKIAGNAKFIVH